MIKKRFLSALLAISMLLTFVPAFAVGNTMTLAAEKVTVAEGATTVSVPITVSNNAGIGIFQVAVNYDSDAFKLDSVTEGTVFASKAFEDGDFTASPYTILALPDDNSTVNGTIVTLNFTVKDGAEAGTYPITLEPEIVTDIDEGELEYDIVAGSITIPEVTPAGNMTLAAEKVTVAEGATTVSVPITVSNNAGIGIFQVAVNYDSDAFKLDSVTEGTVFASKAFEDGDFTASPYTILALPDDNSTVNGTIVTLNFTVKDGAEAGTYPITLEPEIVTDIDEGELEYDIVAGSITIPEPVGPKYTETKLVYADGALSLEVADTATFTTASVLVATYTNEGETLVDVAIVPVTVTADSAQPITYSVTPGTSTKAMLWADVVNCMPLADAIAW